VGGGCLRDILIGRVPLILNSEIYASAAIIGAIVQLLGALEIISPNTSTLLAISVTVAIRILAIKYKVKIPSTRNYYFINNR